MSRRAPFTCEMCSKSYDSRSRYQSHIKRCAEYGSGYESSRRERPQNPSRGGVRSRVTEYGSMRDVEHTSRAPSRTSVSRHRNSRASRRAPESVRERAMESVAESVGESLRASQSPQKNSKELERLANELSRDRRRLKLQLRKYSDALKRKTAEYREEVERLQDYYQDQINSLTEERDQMNEELRNAKNAIFEEREQLRARYSEKTREMRARSSKYEGEQVKRLQETLLSLQQKLDEQDDARQNLERHYREREEVIRQELLAEKAKLNDARMEMAREREQLHALQNNLHHERESMRMDFEQEKKTVLDNSLVEHRTTLEAVNEVNKNLRNRVNELVHELEDAEGRVGLAEHRLKSETERLASMYEASIEEDRALLEERVLQDRANYQLELEQIRKNAAESEAKLVAETQEAIRKARNESSCAISDLRKENEELKTNLERLEGSIPQELSVRTDKIRKEFERDLDQVKDEYEEKKMTLAKTRSEELDAALRRVGEMRDAVRKAEGQVEFYKDMAQRIKENTNAKGAQFTKTLTKQREASRREISERDQEILELKETLAALRARVGETTATYQLRADQAEKNLEKARREVELLRESNTTKDLDLSRVKTENMELQYKLRGAVENFERRCAALENDLEASRQNTSTNLEKCQEARLMVDEIRIRAEKAEHQLDVMKKSVPEQFKEKQKQYKTTLLDMEKRLAMAVESLEKQQSAAQRERSTLLARCEKAEHNAKQQVDTLNELYSTARAEVSAANERVQTLQKKLNEQTHDLTSQLAKVNKTKDLMLHHKERELESLRQEMERLRQEKEIALTGSQSDVIRERDRWQAELEIRERKFSEHLTKLQNSIDRLEKEKHNMKENFMSTLNGEVAKAARKVSNLERDKLILQHSLEKERSDNLASRSDAILTWKITNENLQKRCAELEAELREVKERFAQSEEKSEE